MPGHGCSGGPCSHRPDQPRARRAVRRAAVCNPCGARAGPPASRRGARGRVPGRPAAPSRSSCSTRRESGGRPFTDAVLHELEPAGRGASGFGRSQAAARHALARARQQWPALTPGSPSSRRERENVVAAIDHYRANAYDFEHRLSRQQALAASGRYRARHLLPHCASPPWIRVIDPDRDRRCRSIRRAASPTLWIGGDRGQRGEAISPSSRRGSTIRPGARATCVARGLPLDATGACRPRSAASRPPSPWRRGSFKAFGMNEAGLRPVSDPCLHHGRRPRRPRPRRGRMPSLPPATYPARSSSRPFRRRSITIFVNECNDDGRDEFPEACIDAPGVDRTTIHESVGRAATGFFGKSACDFAVRAMLPRQ